MSAYKHKIPQAEDNRSGGEESYLFCTNVNRKKRLLAIPAIVFLLLILKVLQISSKN